MFILSKKLLVKKLRRKTACAFWFRVANEVSHRLTATVWLRGRDSNLEFGLMRPACCRYTTAQLNHCLFIVDSCSFRNCQHLLAGTAGVEPASRGASNHRSTVGATSPKFRVIKGHWRSLRVIKAIKSH